MQIFMPFFKHMQLINQKFFRSWKIQQCFKKQFIQEYEWEVEYQVQKSYLHKPAHCKWKMLFYIYYLKLEKQLL